jgi:hypothetical protein
VINNQIKVDKYKKQRESKRKATEDNKRREVSSPSHGEEELVNPARI